MTTKRTTREHMIRQIENNPEWNVLELGSGTNGWLGADVYADIEDYTSAYKDNRFVQTDASSTPFENKEFDFVICTHVAEHVPDPEMFFNELTRIGHRGYLETPTPFFDNFVVGNSAPPPHGHLWWVTFDDVKNEMCFKPRFQIAEELATPADTTLLIPFFRDSMITSLYWEDSIEFRQDEAIFSYEAGNSNPVKEIDLRNKTIPSSMKRWLPARIRKQ